MKALAVTVICFSVTVAASWDASPFLRRGHAPATTAGANNTHSSACAPKAQHRRGGGSAYDWYTYEDDYVFVECMILIVLIPVAIMFEWLHHELDGFFFAGHGEGHTEDESHYVHLKDELDNPSKVNHMRTSKQWKTLFYRFNAEMMVLGFLAFAVWVGTQCGLWDQFVPPKMCKPNSPRDAATLFTIVDDVHMHLFIAMLLHFVVIAFCIWHAVWVQHVCDDLEVYQAAFCARLRKEPWQDFPYDAFQKGFSLDTGHEDGAGGHTLKDQRVRYSLAQFGFPKGWWFKEHHSNSFQDTYHGLRAWFVHHARKHGYLEDIMTHDKHFDFGLYARMVINDMLEQLVHFSKWSWALCFLFYAVCGVLSHFLHNPGNELEWVMCIIILLNVLLFAWFAVWSWQHVRKIVSSYDAEQSIRYSCDDLDEGEPTQDLAVCSVDKLYLFTTQALNFLSCYALARIIGSKRFYEGRVGGSFFAISYILVYLVNGFILMPHALPWAALMMCIPPYMDHSDEARLKDVLRHRPDGLTADKAAHMINRRNEEHLDDNGLHPFIRRMASTRDLNQAMKEGTISPQMHREIRKREKAGSRSVSKIALKKVSRTVQRISRIKSSLSAMKLKTSPTPTLQDADESIDIQIPVLGAEGKDVEPEGKGVELDGK